MRDSSQAQKLCSLLAGRSEPAPLLGSSSILLYSCASAAPAADGGRAAERQSCSAGRDGSTACPPPSCPLPWPGSGSWRPLQAAACSCGLTGHSWYTQRGQTTLYTGHHMCFKQVPTMSHSSGCWWGPDTFHTLPGIHFQTRGWLFRSSTALAEGLSQLQGWGLSVLSTGGTLLTGLCGHCGPLTHHCWAGDGFVAQSNLTQWSTPCSCHPTF